MQIVFRADASSQIGYGHVMRCLTLARSLREKGASVVFICREQPGHLCDLLESEGFSVKRLPASSIEDVGESQLAHARWLGATWQEDAEQTQNALASLESDIDWLVVDHYAIDEHWENQLRSNVKQVMVIDDIADRNHNCELLLDQNLIENMERRYDGKTPEKCNRLLGPEYALLHPVYREMHECAPARSNEVNRIFIFFGGADKNNLTGRTLNAVLALNRKDIKVDVVVSKNHPNFDEIEKQACENNNIHFHHSLLSLAQLMLKADLAIGAGGATNWERLCLGLPAIVVTLADNQIPIAKTLHQHSLIRWIGKDEDVDEAKIQNELLDCLDGKCFHEWSSRCYSYVDGKGAERIAAAIIPPGKDQLHVRKFLRSNMSFLVTWKSNVSEDALQSLNRQIRMTEENYFSVIENDTGVPVSLMQFHYCCNNWNIYYVLAPYAKDYHLSELLHAAIFDFRSRNSDALTFKVVHKEAPGHVSVFTQWQPGVCASQKPLTIGLCSDKSSWINEYIPELLLNWINSGHTIRWTHDATQLPEGDLCFYLSYGRIVNSETLSKHKNNLVVHESALPKGKGWSPLTWQVLEGADSIPVTLFEAAESVDSGAIYLQEHISLKGDELVDELRRMQYDSTQNLCLEFVRDYPEILAKAKEQSGEESIYPRRRPKDSQLDVNKSLSDQFNQLRVADNERYPAYFELNGNQFILNIKR